MNSDNYEFAKSSHPQSVSEYSSYSDKQWNYVSDINSGVYSNNSGLTLVTWDLTSIYNAAGLSDVSDLYLAVPIVMVATCSVGAVIGTAPTAGYALCSLKSNYQNLIHQIEVSSNGKIVSDMQPFVNVVKNFQLLSQMSATDLKATAPSLNINECLDNEKSVQWVTSTLTAGTPQIGIGLCNNKPFASAAPGVQVVAQNSTQYNNAIYNRVSRIADSTVNNTFNAYYGTQGTTVGTSPATILTVTQLNAEYKPYYTQSGGIMTWYDVAIIPLKLITDVCDKIGLVKKLDMGLRIYFNTGTVQANVLNAGGVSSYGPFTSNFSNTCPLTINYLNGSVAAGSYAAATTFITAGVFISKPPSTFGPTQLINLTNVASHPMPSCRCYYSQVKLDPQRMLTYVEENRSKQIVYENFLYNQYTSIGIGATFSQLIQSGIKNPIGIVIIPLISTIASPILGNAGFGFSQYGSPYDTCPASYAPLSLTNLAVTLGGVNVMNTNIFYTFENFMEQVSMAESLTSADIGISTGLINQSYWEQNRCYYVDLSRGRSADKDTMRNLCITFNNNSNVPIDVLVFTLYLDKFVIDVETGIIIK